LIQRLEQLLEEAKHGHDRVHVAEIERVLRNLLKQLDQFSIIGLVY